ncbi:GH92 family glycosyl hydrolase [Virgisporangium aliadipatigenens]|nr:GH92 family glycosyl hydrolase [Virgisporangium aliadipatigenens]
MLAGSGTAAAQVPQRAPAPGTAFASSFEAADPQPTWSDTVDTDAAGNKRVQGVDGAFSDKIPGNIMDKVDQITASGEFVEAGEVKENLVDGDPQSKWLTFQRSGWAQVRLGEPVAVVHYALTSANDAPERDPVDWRVLASNDGETWSTVDTRTGEAFTGRFQLREFRFENTTAYRYYRLDIARTNTDLIQLAEWQLSDGDTTPPPPSDMRSATGKGPAGSPTAKPGVGYTGLRAFQIAGRHLTEGRAYSYNRVFDVDIPVARDTELSYLVFPEFTADDLRYPATYTAVDLAFTDGTYLSALNAEDQHGATLSPRGQGDSKTLYTQQWNAKRSLIGAVAAGKRIDRILVGYDAPAGPTQFRAWYDDIRVGTAPKAPTGSLADHVLTTRGTNASGGFSRGNNFPATAVPHGFNFWTPVMHAGSTDWLYQWQRANNGDNRPTLEAFSASHEPSPWMGERQTFQVMPQGAAVPNADRGARALAFGHENETAKPHYYGVTFDNGLRTELAPTDHAALFRFTFTGNEGSLVFDNVDDGSSLTIDPSTGVVTGWSDVRSGGSTGATRLYVYATFDRSFTGSGMLPAGNRVSTGYVAFDTSAQKSVTMRIATSLISTAQAKHNLELELSTSDTLESVRDRARQLWDKQLGVITVEGATQDQLTTLYSNLYRLFLYPNSGHENVGTRTAPVWKHAVQSATTTPPSGPTETGAPVVDGKVYVNNGFWDTYRTTWPAYTLFAPRSAGEMIDGFVQQYKDGGWISRWSSPGYADLMVGTSSDVAFADAYLKGVRNFDVSAAYDAAVKNATVTPPNDNVGRKGLARSTFLGYTPLDVTGEAMSWAMDGYINDFGIANMAKARYEAARPDDPQKQRFLTEYQYFRDRALNYVNMFDPGVGFFQGKDSAGNWRRTPAEYDPRVWGYDYTETDGWNMAFHAPQDGAGLAALYGGKDGLAKKLDAFFADPETGKYYGSYPGIIHEMLEARDVRMGQYGHSNQPSHHILYMYDYAGQPWKTQQKVREATSRLYLGSEIGQGYPGDEDNGEMSAWQVFSALGFYPLQMGSPYYAVGSPLFKKATVHLENGKKLVVNAPNNSAENVYVQKLRINGKSYDRTYLPHDLLAKGATLDFTMGDKPSAWGTGAGDAPLSITPDGESPRPARDVSTGTGPLFDNDSATAAPVTTLSTDVAGAERVTRYTLTSGAGTDDPTGWKLEGSYDGTRWTTVDERTGESFAWRKQTRPFSVKNPGRYAHYRITFTGGSLAEFELLATPAPACTSTVGGTHAGALNVTGGVTCLAPGAVVTGPVTVTGGGSLLANGATVKGPLATAGAKDVVLVGSTVEGSAFVTASTGEVALESSRVAGAALVLTNRGTANTVAASTVEGPLSCSFNAPPPTGNGLPNDVRGPRVDQCRAL